MIQNRDRMYINVVKGIAVVLMIWGHCIQYCSKGSFDIFDNTVFRFIYSFHMPLFMLVSGYLFSFSSQKRDLKTLLIHRTQGLLQPIVFCSMLYIFSVQLAMLVINGWFHIFDGYLLSELFVLWFLWCVLSSSIAVALADKLAPNSWIRVLFLVLGVFLVSLFPENEYHLYMYPYFVAGFYFAKYRARIPKWITRCAFASLFVFPAMIPFYEMKHFIYITPVFTPDIERKMLLEINLFRWAIGFAGSLFVLTLTRLVFHFCEGSKAVSGLLRGLSKLGENSLAIYCLSVPLLSFYLSLVYDKFLQYAGRNIFAENILVYNYAFTPVLTVLYCFGLYFVVFMMKKLKIHKFFFGR